MADARPAASGDVGQTAFEAWRGPHADLFGTWESLLPSEKRAWARCEADVLAKAEAQPAVTGWVSVEERLPSEDVFVLLADVDGSTNAGGVTHREARSLVRTASMTLRERSRLVSYIEQREAALATLTRDLVAMTSDRDHWQQWANKLSKPAVAERKEQLSRAYDEPAPLPGGQGPVEALRKHMVASLRAEAGGTMDPLHRIADRLEQADEGREG